MKKLIFLALGSAVLAVVSMHFWIRTSVQENIKIAVDLYHGTAEESLISLVQDEQRSFRERTHIGIWTLGQIQSRKALPTLIKYYQNDPDGESCYQKHAHQLCQYELHKAITAIEDGRLLSFSNLK